MTPRARRQGILAETVADEMVVYDRERHVAHVLKPAAAAVWRHADGTKTVAELVDVLRAKGLPGADEALVLAALGMLADVDLLERDPVFASDVMSRREALGKVASVALPLVSSVLVSPPLEAASGQTVTCPLSVGPSEATAPAGGGSGSVSVVIHSSCAWSTTTNREWLTVSPASGQGSGSIVWTAQANPLSSDRFGYVEVKSGGTAVMRVNQPGQTQPCTLTVSPSSASVPSSGGSGTVAVTSECTWAASANAAWLTLTNANGQGNGSISWAASSNLESAPRVGVITARAGDSTATVTITQAGRDATAVNGSYRGTATLRQPYGCGDFFIRTYEAAATVSIFADGRGTVRHESLTGGYYRTYEINSVTVLPNGDVQIVSAVQNWVIGGVPFRGLLRATISGRNYKEEEELTRADGTCRDYFDTVATKV